MKGVTVPGSSSSTEKLSGSGLGLGKISGGPEQPGLFKGLSCFLHLSPLGDRGGVVLTENILMKDVMLVGVFFGGGGGRGRVLTDRVGDGA